MVNNEAILKAIDNLSLQKTLNVIQIVKILILKN